ncbi:hypothetical protein JXA63_01860 [Candidatus Woesebacteria bacterium]|nr:hypothetical protein [Candidatus Woesebacteria bacterium]
MKIKKLKVFLRHNKRLTIILLLLLGFILRLFLTRFGNLSGDILVFGEWGMRFWQYPLDKFYRVRDWQYSFPTYPPLSSLMYGGIFWLNDHRYLLAQIHNATRLIPSFFVSFFGKVEPSTPFMWNNGYFMLLKLPSVLADVGISLIIYKVVLEISKSSKKALGALIFYLFNPLTIFLSSFWGQTESLIAFFGIYSFYLLHKKSYVLSIVMLFCSLFIKPNWVVFIPVYLYILYINKPKIRDLFFGAFLSILLLFIFTYPFSGFNVLGFLKNTIIRNMLPASKGAQKLTNSAFNIYSILSPIDSVLVTKRFLISDSLWGWTFFLLVNIFVIKNVIKKNASAENIFSAIFAVGMAAFLFLTGMLDRYFFPAFPALIVLVFADIKSLAWGMLLNFSLFANLIWAFYRRDSHEIRTIYMFDHQLLIKFLSITNLIGYFKIIKLNIGRKLSK